MWKFEIAWRRHGGDGECAEGPRFCLIQSLRHWSFLMTRFHPREVASGTLPTGQVFVVKPFPPSAHHRSGFFSQHPTKVRSRLRLSILLFQQTLVLGWGHWHKHRHCDLDHVTRSSLPTRLALWTASLRSRQILPHLWAQLHSTCHMPRSSESLLLRRWALSGSSLAPDGIPRQHNKADNGDNPSNPKQDSLGWLLSVVHKGMLQREPF